MPSFFSITLCEAALLFLQVNKTFSSFKFFAFFNPNYNISDPKPLPRKAFKRIILILLLISLPLTHQQIFEYIPQGFLTIS